MEMPFSDVSAKRDWDSVKFLDVAEVGTFSLVSVIFTVLWQEGAESPSSTGPCREHVKKKNKTFIHSQIPLK